MTTSEGGGYAYPLFLGLADRPVLVVGAGEVAREKALALRAAGALVSVVAPRIDSELAQLAHRVDARPFEPRDLDGKWLAVAAATPPVNAQVRQACDARRIFVVAVDDVARCSAIGAAVLRRGGLTLAISSDGRAPALVALLRRALAELIPDEVEAWVDLAEQTRIAWKARGVAMRERRPLLLRALNAMYERGEVAP